MYFVTFSICHLIENYVFELRKYSYIAAGNIFRYSVLFLRCNLLLHLFAIQSANNKLLQFYVRLNSLFKLRKIQWKQYGFLFSKSMTAKVYFPLDIFAIIQFAAIDNVRKVIVSNYIACYCRNNVCWSLLIR